MQRFAGSIPARSTFTRQVRYPARGRRHKQLGLGHLSGLFPRQRPNAASILGVMSVSISHFLTTKEAAEIIGVNDSRVRQFCLEGRLKPERVGSMLFFDRRQIERFAAKPRPSGKPLS